MRGILIWGVGAMLAFLVTAGAFLVLANLSSSLSTRSVAPTPAPSNSAPLLRMNLSEASLEELEKAADQTLPLSVDNTGESTLSNISLTMRVTSENTAQPRARYYRATIKELEAGASKTVRFTLDLSAPKPSDSPRPTSSDLPEPRSVLEVQATTPEGISAVKTAVLPF